MDSRVKETGTMNYLDEYKDYVEDEKIVFDRVPPEVVKEAMKGKTAMLIFFENLDLCHKKLGETPVVARILYEVAAYDRMVDKDNYKIPDFSKYENGEMAEVVFEVMINSAKTNFKTYITNTMQNRYNGSKNKKKKQEEDPDVRWPPGYTRP